MTMPDHIRASRVAALLVACVLPGCANGPERARIRSVLDAQVQAWNRGDMEGFMAGYWKSDDMLFVSPSGTTKGWQATLDRYRSRYASPAQMGTLQFDRLAISLKPPDGAEVSGRYILRTTSGMKSGTFRLTFRRIDDHWVIIRDHTIPDEQ